MTDYHKETEELSNELDDEIIRTTITKLIKDTVKDLELLNNEHSETVNEIGLIPGVTIRLEIKRSNVFSIICQPDKELYTEKRREEIQTKVRNIGRRVLEEECNVDLLPEDIEHEFKKYITGKFTQEDLVDIAEYEDKVVHINGSLTVALPNDANEPDDINKHILLSSIDMSDLEIEQITKIN